LNRRGGSLLRMGEKFKGRVKGGITKLFIGKTGKGRVGPKQKKGIPYVILGTRGHKKKEKRRVGEQSRRTLCVLELISECASAGKD